MCKGCRGRHTEALPALAQHWEAGGEGQSRRQTSWAEGSSQEEAGYVAACTGVEKRQEAIDLVAKQSDTGQRMLTFFQSLLWHSMRLETSSTSRNVPTCSTLTAASRVCYVALLGNETP